jgi:hypothetical protein
MTFIYSSTCFGRFPAHHQELNDCSSSLWFYLRIVVIAVLCSWSGRLTGYHHDTKVKPEAATAVVELLMMGGRTPQTRWAVNKRQDNKLKDCCIRLVIWIVRWCTDLQNLNTSILFKFKSNLLVKESILVECCFCYGNPEFNFMCFWD